MYLIYLDESGNSGQNLDDPNQPIHYIGALIVHSSKWLKIEQEMEAIVDGLGITGTARENFEFHATDLYQGTGFFKGWSPKDRFDTFEKLLEVAADNDLPIIYAGVKKQKLRAQYAHPANPHDLAFLLVAERVERWFCNHDPKETGIYIADEIKGKVEVKKSLRQYRRTGIQFGNPTVLNHVIDTIHFADSRETCLIQLADCCLYAIKRKVEGKANADRFFNIIDRNRASFRFFP